VLVSTAFSSGQLSISIGADSARNAGTPTVSNTSLPAQPRSTVPAATACTTWASALGA